jgi:hypothetical protein
VATGYTVIVTPTNPEGDPLATGDVTGANVLEYEQTGLTIDTTYSVEVKTVNGELASTAA